ncbi:MAG: AsmA family protein [Alphaproteobacteria bacterium]|nr:AsmA family protein [Alphaproteobacteria bacterium]
MFVYAFYRRHLWLLRGMFLFFMGLIVAIIVALNQMNLESLRGSILSVLRDSTNMQIEIDGKMTWRFSLRPEIQLNSVRIPNADWANQKNLFSAKKIDVRLDFFSLFKSRPVIRYIKIHDAKINLEKNDNDEWSVVVNEVKKEENNTAEKNIQMKYPVERLPFGGLEIENVKANIGGEKYELSSFGIHNYMHDENVEYSGWVKPYDTNFPFVIKFSEYNAERKIYPMQVAFATGGQALIADIALEGKSKLPIDFVVRGDIPNIRKSGNWFNVNIIQLPTIKINIAGGIDRKKISFRKSSIDIGESALSFSGIYDWSKSTPKIDAKINSNKIDIYKSFPEWFGVGKEWVHPNRDLNVFKDMPLFGEFLYNIDMNLELNWKKFVVYHSLDLENMNVKLKVQNHKLRADVSTEIASGNIDAVIIANINEQGRYTAEAGAHGNHIYVGDILKEIDVDDVISGLPVNLDLYVRANGNNMSQIMKSMTGPVVVYSVDKGYAHADLVEYMYGGDFLTSLRNNVEDLFSGNKRDMIAIKGAVVNVKLRNGLIETQNGVAVETQAINVRLAGTLDLGKEKIDLSLATVPVRGLKLSLSGNLVNALQITGNLAEPDIKISGGAIAGKVGSAVGLGLLLAPLTGGLSVAGGFVAGLIAGDLLESWLADENPCKTAKKHGAHAKRGDPEWLNRPIANLYKPLFENR